VGESDNEGETHPVAFAATRSDNCGVSYAGAPGCRRRVQGLARGRWRRSGSQSVHVRRERARRHVEA
jgi:hypothetical protein